MVKKHESGCFYYATFALESNKKFYSISVLVPSVYRLKYYKRINRLLSGVGMYEKNSID